jgi:hypothetical protein
MTTRNWEPCWCEYAIAAGATNAATRAAARDMSTRDTGGPIVSDRGGCCYIDVKPFVW